MKYSLLTILIFSCFLAYGENINSEIKVLVDHYFARYINDDLVDTPILPIKYFQRHSEQFNLEKHGRKGLNFYIDKPEIISVEQSNENVDLISKTSNVEMTIVKVKIHVIAFFNEKISKNLQILKDEDVYDYILLVGGNSNGKLRLFTHYPNLWDPDDGGIGFINARNEMEDRRLSFSVELKGLVEKLLGISNY